jgi:para-nitrobenzyl esterase
VATPLAKGLFIRAIGESGGRFDRTPFLSDDRSGQSAEKTGLAFAQAVGADSLAALRALPAEKLVAVATFRTQENVDGWVLPDEIRTIFASRHQNNVPVIVGSNANEMTSLAGAATAPKTLEEFRRRLAQQYGDLASEFEKVYRVSSAGDIVEASLASARDTVFSLHMRTWARRTVEAGSKAFLYYFSHVPPHPRAAELKAFHAGEIPYVFNVVPSSDPRETAFAYTDVDKRLAETMSSYWVNFVSSGDPNGRGLPHWPAYDLQMEPYLEFGDTIKAGTHLLKPELDFQERALQRQLKAAAR